MKSRLLFVAVCLVLVSSRREPPLSASEAPVYAIDDLGSVGGNFTISYARMDPAALGLSPDPAMLRSRVAKMVAKDIGVLYYGLPLSDNPRSALYGNIGGTDELDVMTEYFDPQPTMPASW